jgi:amino acid transporter
MAPTAASFAELASRMPVSAGEAAYVEAGFRSQWLALLTGILVIFVGITSAAAISRGAAGYIGELLPLPYAVILSAVILAMGLVAAKGVLESVAVAALMTVIEIAGLLVIVAVGVYALPGVFTSLPQAAVGLGQEAALAGILSASLLAFFAFIGFESLANMAEEVHEPSRVLPRAIALTLTISTVLYVLVVWVALIAVPREELVASPAPLSLVYRTVTGASPTIITLVAIIASINGIIAQMLMASRVIYGLARRGLLPSPFAIVDARTRTPLIATALTVLCVLALGLGFRIEPLAETTSRFTLAIFVLVNGSLLALKLRHDVAPPGALIVPTLVPIAGVILCLGLLIADMAK